MTIEIITAAAGLVTGAVIGFLIGRNRKKERELAAQVQVLMAQADALREQMAVSKEEWERHSGQLLEAKDKACADSMAAQDRRYTDALAAQQAKFDETIAKVTAQMKSATEEMLKRRQDEFAASSSTSIGQIVNPLRETIGKMEEALAQNARSQTAMSSEMKAQLENMMRTSQAAKDSADELSRVFRHAGRVQGDWGEIILDELLESQGFTRGVHYDTQSSIRDAAGGVVRSGEDRSMRPDVILHLDHRREVIVDSKVSLTAYMDYVNAEDESLKQKYLKSHVDSIRNHVRELAAKDYSSYIKPPKVRMDYVIMFVPNAGALWSALNAQPDLWRKSMDRNVFIADEQTLFAALRIINLTWTQIAQAQNHEKVYALASEMLDRVGQFMKRYEAMGKALENAQKAYNEGRDKLTPGGQSIIQTCAKLQKLGARQSTSNPLPQLLDIDDIPQTEQLPGPEG